MSDCDDFIELLKQLQKEEMFDDDDFSRILLESGLDEIRDAYVNRKIALLAIIATKYLLISRNLIP